MPSTLRRPHCSVETVLQASLQGSKRQIHPRLPGNPKAAALNSGSNAFLGRFNTAPSASTCWALKASPTTFECRFLSSLRGVGYTAELQQELHWKCQDFVATFPFSMSLPLPGTRVPSNRRKSVFVQGFANARTWGISLVYLRSSSISDLLATFYHFRLPGWLTP